MSFLNQALLFGLFAVSIPIVIHLLNRRRFRKVKWAAMRFLTISVEQNQRRMKLEDYVLLIVRCALVALLALAVARPVVEGLRSALPGSKTAVAIVIDSSASMRTAAGNGTRLEEARAAAREVLDHLPPGSPVAISTPFQSGEPTTDHDLARRRIESVAPTDRHADLRTALESAARAIESQAAAGKELYLLTDAQAAEWSAFAALEGTLRKLSAGLKLHLVLVGTLATTNLGLSRLVPSGSLPAVNQPFRLDVDVTNYGPLPATDVPVSLLLDGQAVDEPWIIDEIQPGRSESATLYVTLPSADPHRVTVALAGDDVPFDDRRTMVLRASEEVRILLVDGEPGAEARESETFFLRFALAPVPDEERAAYPVKPSVVTVSEFANQNMSDYAAIVLANVSDLTLPVADKLAAFVAAGGGLVVFPGPNVRTEFYNTILHAKFGLLPAALLAPQPGLDSGTRTLMPTETNPLGLEAGLLGTATFRHWFTLADSDSGGSRRAGRVVLRYDDGSPAVMEHSHGLGKVFLFTSTADTAWNDLAVEPGFVPLVNRIVGAIVQHRDATLNIEAGEQLTQRVAANLAGKEATIYELDDPASLGRLTTIEEVEGVPTLRFDETDRAGAYQATIDGASSPLVFAARPSGRESPLEMLGSEQLARLADSATVIRWSGPGSAEQLGAARPGSELWLPLVFLVIGIAAVELGLAQWFSRSK